MSKTIKEIILSGENLDKVRRHNREARILLALAGTPTVNLPFARIIELRDRVIGFEIESDKTEEQIRFKPGETRLVFGASAYWGESVEFYQLREELKNSRIRLINESEFKNFPKR